MYSILTKLVLTLTFIPVALHYGTLQYGTLQNGTLQNGTLQNGTLQNGTYCKTVHNKG
jgi:hypothetical protein